MVKIVARFADGRMIKGFTGDFVPTKDRFHVTVAGAPGGSPSTEVLVKDLKALFFVRDFAGEPAHKDRNEFDPARPPVGRRIRVLFKDGEVMIGTTVGYQPGRVGLFLVPADPDANTERCFVVTDATESIKFI